ncbi:MAG: 4-hydroxyphenylacetate 3-hydroxylase N-terminal domain-containing protein [Chloroflexota bacterium]
MSNSASPVAPLTGRQYLDSLRDDREVWIYGERVKDVTTHPAFRNSARMVARLYDALHEPESQPTLTCPSDTGSGGLTHRYFLPARTQAELVAGRDAIAAWQRLTYGWMGRSPDYKAAFLANLAVNDEFYDPYQENARRWYKEAADHVLYMNHALVNPPVDRNQPVEAVRDVFVHAVKETDAGIIVNGAKVVATNSALTHHTFVAHHGLPIKSEEFALVFTLPMDAPGMKLICRPSYEMQAAVTGSPFDYPLSSRFDENDAIFVLDNVLVPWENLFIYRDTKRFNVFGRHSGFFQRLCLHGCTRLGVKLDFISGLLLKAIEVTGIKDFRGVQVNVGEVIAWRNLFWALSDAMCMNVEPWRGGTVLPNLDAALAYRVMMTQAYPRVKAIVQNLIASGLIYHPSSTLDWQNPEIRPYLDKYVRGSFGVDAEARIKLIKALWDAIGTEFGGRHELYELNYAGNHETIRFEPLLVARANGLADRMTGFVDTFMAEYDLNGWTSEDLINPDDVNFFKNR